MSDFVEHKLLRGQGAGKWLPFARTKVAALHARAKAMRVTALVQRWTVEGGDVEVAVRVVGDQRYIHIRRKSCPTFASGLVDALLNPLLALYPLVPGTPLVEITPQGDPNPQYALRRFFPSERDAGDVPRAFRDEPRLGRNVEAAKQIFSLESGIFISLKSGQFTSEMRKVVQVLQGMNEVVPYSPLYGLTHGVFVSADGIRWVVEITVNGIVAWVMNVCTAQPVTAENGDILLPYTPLPSPKPANADIPAAIAAGTFKILAGAEAVLDFYTKTPFYVHCGWAFNSTGHEVANVCFTYVGATAQSSLYTITIIEVENAPSAATMQLAEQGLLYGTTNVHMKYPGGIGGKLYSFDTRGPVPVVSNAPVYCWYDGNSLVVARHEFTLGTDTQPVNDGNPGNSPCDSDIGRELRQGSFTQIQSPVLSIDGHTTPARMHNYTGSILRYDKEGVLGGNLANFSVSAGMEVVDVFAGSIFSQQSISDVRGVRATLIIPFYDREAAYLAVEDQRVFSSGSVTSQQKFVTSGESHFSECQETCVALPDRCVLILSGAAGQSAPPANCPTGGGILWQFQQSTNYWPGGETGGVIAPAQQDGGSCAGIPTPSFTAQPDTVFTPPPTDTKDYTFEFIASGGVSQSLPIPSAPVYLVAFIGEGEDQRAASIRDAFAPDRYVISPNTVAELIRFHIRDDAGYPINDTLGGLAWVGVP